MTGGDLSGVVLDGRYKVLEAVAEGAMGVVYRAERLKLGRIVAIKVLHDSLPSELSSRKRFEIEAMAMAKLEHPHCAAVLDVGLHDDKPFVVMDFVSGEDLKSVIAKGPMPVPRALEIMRQVLSGLAHAHELGIIHRDIKPANIILSQKAGLGDHVKILDFGLARLTANQGASLTTGIVLGTPAYMAPEQIRGTVIDGRVDLYACGVLLFELVTGRKPFHSEKDDPIEVVSMHLKRPPPRLDQLKPGTDFGALEDIVARALQKSAEDRYQTATEFVAALDAIGRNKTGPIRSLAMVEPLAEPAAAAPAATDSLAIPQATTSPAATPHAGTRLGIAVAPTPEPPPPASSSPPPVSSPPLSVSSPPPVVSSPPPVVSSAPPVVSSPPPVVSSPPPAPGAVPQLPLRKIAIGGGALLLLLVVIAVVAGGRANKTAVADAGGAVGSGAAPVDPAADVIARANDLAANGEREAAINLLTKARRDYPTSAEIPYVAGKLYFAKLWWTDGLKSFRDAIRIDPAYGGDPEMIKTVLKGFITTPDYNDELASFLRNDIGDPAKPFLEETARDHPNAAVRARAQDELGRYR